MKGILIENYIFKNVEVKKVQKLVYLMDIAHVIHTNI